MCIRDSGLAGYTTWNEVPSGDWKKIVKTSKDFVADITPLSNYQYLRAAFHYGFGYSLNEYLNRGSERKKEKRLKTLYGQKQFLPPSKYAARPFQ